MQTISLETHIIRLHHDLAEALEGQEIVYKVHATKGDYPPDHMENLADIIHDLRTEKNILTGLMRFIEETHSH